MDKKEDKLFGILKDYGPISKSSVGKLSRLEIENMWKWTQEDKLPPNPNKRPICPCSDVTKSSNGSVSTNGYRKSMVNYFSFCIELSPYHPWPLYETLANYFESKYNKK